MAMSAYMYCGNVSHSRLLARTSKERDALHDSDEILKKKKSLHAIKDMNSHSDDFLHFSLTYSCLLLITFHSNQRHAKFSIGIHFQCHARSK